MKTWVSVYTDPSKIVPIYSTQTIVPIDRTQIKTVIVLIHWTQKPHDVFFCCFGCFV